MDRDQVLKELIALQHKFDALKPELEITVRDPELNLEGYVVVWSTLASRGGSLGRCGKGGTRITPHTTLEEVSMLARIMTLKNAAAGLPLGGAKSGIKADSTSADFKKRYTRFAELVKPVLRENGGIFGGLGFDIGAKPEHATWACEALGTTVSFTGKPVELGGTDYDREGIAGLGVAEAGRVALAHRKKPVSDATFAVQGLGAMGGAVVRYFSELGAKLKVLSDPRLGGTYRLKDPAPAEMIDAISALNFSETKKTLKTISHEKLPLDRVLYEKVDVLFPCAVQDVITLSNAEKVEASFVIEGANKPLTRDARTLLHNNGKLVIPDFLANPGGIIAAYVEMTSEVTIEENIAKRTKVREAKAMTQEKIAKNVEKVLTLASSLGIEPAQAGMYYALKNIFQS